VEQSGQTLLGAQPGARLVLRDSAGMPVTLPLAGWLHDPGMAPSTQEQTVYAWATPDVAGRLQQATGPDQLLVKLARRGSPAEAAEQGNRLAAWADGAGRPAVRTETLAAQHPHALLMTAMSRMLGILSAMAFMSSAAWSAYMVSLWMRREQRVVGILKSLGARHRQIAAQYLLLAGPLMLLAAGLAVPLGAAVGQAFVAHEAVELNIDLASTRVAGSWRALTLCLALCLPLLSVAWPVWRAARLTPREAMADAGVGTPGGTAVWRARWLRLPGDRRWTLALRNSFRRPWRLTLMVAALAIGGALLLTSHSNHEAVMATVDASLANQAHDIEVAMQQPAPAGVLVAVARTVPGVEWAEAWRRSGVTLADGPAAGPEPAGSRVALAAFPAGSRLQRRPVVEGRLPRDGAADEVLATRYLLAAYPQLHLDAPVRLRHHGREAMVRIVGLVEEIGQATLLAPEATFEAVTGMGDAASSLRVQARAGVPLTPLAHALDQALLEARHTPAQVITRDLIRDALDEHVRVVGGVVRMVALAAALVGGLWLAASTGLGVLERTRETGVLRALGATPRDFCGMYLAEGAAVAGLATLLAVGLAMVLIAWLGDLAGRQLLHATVHFHISPKGLAILAAGLLVLIGAVALAVQRVLRLSAREALACE
jgi:putative ABC transport system permease protein